MARWKKRCRTCKDCCQLMRGVSLSVASICFNNLEDLKLTCSSVDAQTRRPDEHWIIDGSTDRRILDWLGSTPQPAYRKWLHERDAGISDAFNKGIFRSSGDVIHLLNSGDRYYIDNAIAMNLAVFNRQPLVNWTHSRYVQHRGKMDVISGVRFDAELLWRGMRTVAHPTIFVRRILYEQAGGYDTTLRVAMDYDFLVRIRNQPFQFIEEPLVYFAPGGVSQQSFSRGLREVRRSYRNHVGWNLKMPLWQLRQRALKLFMATAAGRTWFSRKNRGAKA